MTEEQRYQKLLHEFIESGATVEDLARAWASIDGNVQHFDAGRSKSVFDDESGHYAGYMAEAAEQLERATMYARSRREDK
jgi:hypothetical protein